MRLGYIKGSTANIDQLDHNTYNDIDKLYVDNVGEHIALKELQAYCRRGDVIVVRDIRDLCGTAGEFVELLCNLSAEGVSISCVSQRVDTSTFEWQAMLRVLRLFGQMHEASEKEARWIAELDACFDLVERREMTVEEACRKMNIGKSTYYRRWRQVKSSPVKERHPERFAEYDERVQRGEISVTDACKEMNIGITTYYRMRKDQIDHKRL